MLKLLTSAILIVFVNTVSALEPNFLNYIKNSNFDTTLNILPVLKCYDFSSNWLKFETIYIRGFIGKDYQRLYMHISEYVKLSGDVQSYKVIGKSKVKNNMCAFEGELNIEKVYIKNDPEYGLLLIALGTFILKENEKERNVGVFKGTFCNSFYITANGNYANEDYFVENYLTYCFSGKWYSNSSELIKECGWGYERIPFSGDLDNGASGFFPAQKYLKSGWQSFHDAYILGDTNALKIEEEKWWEKKE